MKLQNSLKLSDSTVLQIGSLSKLVEAHVQAYKIEHNETPGFTELAADNYLKSPDASCPDGSTIVITAEGDVKKQ